MIMCHANAPQVKSPEPLEHPAGPDLDKIYCLADWGHLPIRFAKGKATCQPPNFKTFSVVPPFLLILTPAAPTAPGSALDTYSCPIAHLKDCEAWIMHMEWRRDVSLSKVLSGRHTTSDRTWDP